MMDLDRFNILLLVMLIVSTLANAETTNNLLPQQFFNNNSNHNEWTCNDPSHNHGNSIVAAHHGDSIERDVSLSEHLTEDQIQYGWSSTLGADIWHWNNLSSETDMIQTITASDGTVTTQKRTVAFSAITPYQTYTSTYIEGMNSNSDYNINVKFDFRESSEAQYHQAVDLKNPTLVVDYEPNPIFLSTIQETEIATAVEFVEEVADIEIIEYEPQEFSFELYDTQEIMLMPIEEVYIETLAVEEINTGVVEIFNLAPPVEEFSEMAELPQIETFDELPTIGEEIRYDSQENFSEVATEIQIEESFFEAGESYDNQGPVEGIQEIESFFAEEPIAQNESPADFESVDEPRPVDEEIVATNEGAERSTMGGPDEQEVSGDEQTIAQEQPEQIDNESETISNEPQTEDTVVASEEITNESTGVAGEDEIDREGEARTSRNGDAGDETNARAEEDIESGNQEVEESGNERVSPRDNQTITVENVEKKVNELVKRIDQRLVATSVIVAKAMQSSFSVDNYGKVNKDILNQPNIDGGDYFETRQYIDVRNLYAENQNVYGDPVAQYQKNVQDKVDERIRAEEHLRRIRGY
jgi:hypothetical protein